MPGPAHIALLQNAALLLAMVVIFDLMTSRLRLEGKAVWQVLVGAILGGLGIGLILASFRLESGIVFDTRSVLLCMSGLFFGTIPTLVAMAMTAAFRLWQGGAAAWTGGFVILATGGLGILWRRYRQGRLEEISARELYIFGVVVHLVMLALMLTLPWATARRVLAGIGLPVLVVYPLATAALGLLLANRLRREHLGIALAESEERYRSLFENNHATMLIINPADGAIVDANPAACRFYGWTREQLRQMRIHQINTLPPDQLQAEMDRARAKEDYHFLFTHRRADGSLRDVEVFSGPVSTGDQHLLCSIIHDITERRRAETALRENEERLRLLGDNLPNGYVYQYQHGPTGEPVFSYISAGVQLVHGLTPAEVLRDGKCLRAQTEPDQLPAMAAAEAASARTLADFGTEVWVRRPDGERRLIRLRSRPRRTADGQVCWDGFAVDITEQHRTQAILQRWADAFNNCAHGIGLGVPGENRVLICNPAFARMLGRTVEELTGSAILSLYAPEDHELIRQCQGEADRTGRVRYEAHMVRKDGSAFPVQMDIVTVRDATGKPLYRVATAQDITDRRSAEESLLKRLELQDQLAKIASTVPGVIYSFRQRPDGTACLPFATRAIEDFSGLKPEEVREDASPLFARFHPDDLNRVLGEIAESARTMRPWHSTFRVHHPSKGELWAEGHSVPRLEADGSILWHGYVQDVTERQRMESERTLFANTIAASVNELYLFDAGTWRYRFVSAGAQQNLGYTLEQLQALTPLDLEPEMDRAAFEQLVGPLLRREKTMQFFETVHRRADGTRYPVEVRLQLFEHGADRVFLAVVQDVTQRKRLEAQLHQAQKLEAIGQLAGGVAHDFNNILAAIMMHLGLLQMNNTLDEETRHALKDLDKEAQRAANLTRQLLMFSRRSVLAVKPLDLNEVVANLLKMLGRLIGEQIDLRFDGKTGLPPVEADAGMLEQVLMNLVVNARDAMPKGGRVTISTSLAKLNEADAAASPERRPGRFVCLAVSDTGTGMDAEILKHIFDPFFTTKEAGKGTGLGLATVHGIVAQHKGWVEVESEVGRGTTFRVFLPAQTAAITESPVAQPVEPMQRGRETILLVEDEAKVRQMIGQALRVLGYRVYEAVNGQEAMKLWQTHGAQVDLLLTDMVMPEGITGLELTERLQALRPGLKAIISSGYSAEIVQSGVPTKAGVLYLPKPYEARKLAEVVRQCLDRKT